MSRLIYLKKLLMIIIIVLITAIFTFPITTADENRVYFNPNFVSASYSNTVDVEIRVNATNFQGGDIELTYDATCCEVIDFQENSIFTDVEWNSTKYGEEFIRFDKGLPTLNGDILIGTFTIMCMNEDVCITELDIDDIDSKLFNDFGIEIYVIWENGEFSSGLPKNGDIDGDGDIDIEDATYLARHYYEIKYPGSFPDHIVIHANGDINCDGEIDIEDAVYLARHYYEMKYPDSFPDYKNIYPCT